MFKRHTGRWALCVVAIGREPSQALLTLVPPAAGMHHRTSAQSRSYDVSRSTMTSSISTPALPPENVTPMVAASSETCLPPTDATAPVSAPGASLAAAPLGMSPAQCGERLKALFPAHFVGAIKPLKLRIQVDIQERAPGVFSKQVLSSFFRRHTGSTSYLIAVSKSQHRFDLDGQPAGEVSAEHKQAALEELARRRANNEARREKEEQERRQRASLLRNFQSTTLTRANFCALNGVAEEALDALLAQAEQEAKELVQRPVPPPRDKRQAQGPERRPAGSPPRRAGRPSHKA